MTPENLIGHNLSRTFTLFKTESSRMLGKTCKAVVSLMRWAVSPVTDAVYSMMQRRADNVETTTFVSEPPSTPLSQRRASIQKDTQEAPLNDEGLLNEELLNTPLPNMDMELDFLIPMFDKAMATANPDNNPDSEDEDTSLLMDQFQEPQAVTQGEETPQATGISEEITQTLQRGLDTTNPNDMPQILGEYTVAIGRFVQQQNEISEAQQSVMRNGYIELLAHGQALSNPDYTRKMFGISGGKLSIAMRVDMLEQVRDVLRIGGQGMATQISTAARLGPLMASRIDLLGCSGEAELRELVFGRGLNIDMFCISGAEANITNAQTKVAKREKQLAEERAKPVDEQNPEEITRLCESIRSGTEFIAENRTELENKQTLFAQNETRHLDQLFFDVTTRQEQTRREKLPEALAAAISATRGSNNKKKYENPDKVIESATEELMTAARIKVLGHMTSVGGNWSETEKNEKIQAEFKVRTQKLRCAYNELLLHHFGVDKFLTLPHLGRMTDDDRGILRDHLIRNLPVNIPLANKERLLTALAS